LNVIKKLPFTEKIKHIESMLCTNLANALSSQGRAFCCIELYDRAIELDNNPVAIVNKARNELFIAQSLYDEGHTQYHYLKAYELIKEGLSIIDQLEEEQRIDLEEGGELLVFKEWFEKNYNIESFDYFSEYKEDLESKEQEAYLKWSADSCLFLNDLNDVFNGPIVYQDIMALPSTIHKINPTLTLTEKLMYHGNFDEIKNDFCYARYLIFQSKDIDNEQGHIFNKTYPHIDAMCGSIDNLKTNQYKSAFKILYSLFDKIAYFTSRFFDLNDIKLDTKINIDSLFKNIKNRKEWQPHPNLEDGQNFFINSLFFILKDIKNVKGHDSVSTWIDYDAQTFSEIRNAIEHRSLKIVSNIGYDLATNGNLHTKVEQEKILKHIEDISLKLQEKKRAYQEATKKHNVEIMNSLAKEIALLESESQKLEALMYEKEKLSSHTLLITVENFEMRLFRLIKLVRNAIMYLSLAIHLSESMKEYDGIALPYDLPLK